MKRLMQRWTECDALEDPIEKLVCRTGQLNDFAHRTDERLIRIDNKLTIYGFLAVVLGPIIGQLARIAGDNYLHLIH